jgi:hypothetical protein
VGIGSPGGVEVWPDRPSAPVASLQADEANAVLDDRRVGYLDPLRRGATPPDHGCGLDCEGAGGRFEEEQPYARGSRGRCDEGEMGHVAVAVHGEVETGPRARSRRSADDERPRSDQQLDGRGYGLDGLDRVQGEAPQNGRSVVSAAHESNAQPGKCIRAAAEGRSRHWLWRPHDDATIERQGARLIVHPGLRGETCPGLRASAYLPNQPNRVVGESLRTRLLAGLSIFARRRDGRRAVDGVPRRCAVRNASS